MDSVDLVTFLELIGPRWRGDLLVGPREDTVSVAFLAGTQTAEK